MTSLNDTIEEGELEEGEIGDEPVGKESEKQKTQDGAKLKDLDCILIENASKDSDNKHCTEKVLPKNKKQKHFVSSIKKEIYRDKHVCHLKDKRSSGTSKVKHSVSIKSFVNKNLTPKYRHPGINSTPYASARSKWFEHKIRNLNTSQDISYEDLLNQYKQIQSKVENFGRRKSDIKLKNKYKTEKDRKNSKGEKVTSEKENHQKQHLNCSKYRRRKKSIKEVSKECSRLKKCIERDKINSTPYVQYKSHKVPEKTALAIKNSEEKCTAKKEEEEDEYILRMKALASRNNLSLIKKKPLAFDKEGIDRAKDMLNECKEELLDGRNKEKIVDNYDLVDMELDSEVEADVFCVPSAPNSVDNGNSKEEEEEEIDEAALRQQLLVALAKRKEQEVSINLVNNENTKESSFVHNFDVEMMQINDHNIQESLSFDYNSNAPLSTSNHQSLVINLEDDSSDCSEFEGNDHSTPEINVQAGLEQLLKQARMESDLKIGTATSSPDTSDTNDATVNFGNTPAAVYRLSRAQQLEYRKLKELIAKKESTRAGDNLTKSHLLKQSCQRLPQFEAKLNICNATLRKENHLMKLLRMHINKKKLALRSAQMNVQKLKQQLSGAEKVVGQNLQIIHKLNMQLKTVQSSAERRSSLVMELEKECSKLGVQLFGTSYKLPLSSLLPLS